MTRPRRPSPPDAESTALAPPLPESERERFDAWIADGLRRHAAALTPRELRRGVRALSSLYVERRAAGRLSARSTEGAAKRAAFATYYAGLHFLAIRALVTALRSDRSLGPDWPGPRTRLLDLGCGTGASGSAAALALAEPGRRTASVLGLDVSGWALGDARRTWRHFGLSGRGRRAALPGALGAPDASGLALAAWAINELAEDARAGVVEWLGRQLRAGGAVLVVEPLAGPAAPWWNDVADALAPAGARSGTWRAHIERPAWIAEMDRASGLDHATMGARWLAGPAAPGEARDSIDAACASES